MARRFLRASEFSIWCERRVFFYVELTTIPVSQSSLSTWRFQVPLVFANFGFGQCFPNLYLYIFDSHFISQSHNLLPSVSASTLDLPNLKTLNISCNRLQALNAVEVLLQCAAFCNALESLNLGLNCFEDDELRAELSKLGLPLHDSLLALGLSTNMSYVEKIAKYLEPQSKLGLPDSLRKSFERNGSRVVSLLALAAAEKDRSIHSFPGTGDFSSLLVSERIDLHLQVLVQRLIQGDNLSMLPVSVNSIKCLNLSACNMSSSSHPALTTVLQRLPALIELNLSLNAFPARSILSILREVPSSLETLIIRNCCICASGLCAAKSDPLFKLSSVTSIDISDNVELQLDGFALFLEMCPIKNLVSLRASNCGIDVSDTDDCGVNILSAMRQAPLLQTFDISNNSLRNGTVESIMSSLLLGDLYQLKSPRSPDIMSYNVPVGSAPWTAPLRHMNISCTTPYAISPNGMRKFNKWFNSILSHFCNLAHLNISESACLVNLSPSVSCLSQLSFINMSHCKNLISIPDELVLASQHRECQMLFFGCDALQYPPRDVAYQGPVAMLQFVKGLEKVRLNNVKVVVLGNGGTGKRSLLRALANIQDSESKSFDDINQRIVRHLRKRKSWMQRLAIVSGDSLPSLTFWSFGGNLEHYPHASFYMSAHQCVYIIVFRASDPHEVLNEQISYWFRAIRERAGASRSIRISLVCSRIERVPSSLLETHKQGIRDLIRKLLASINFPMQFDASQIAVDCWFSANPQHPNRTDEVQQLTNKIFNLSEELVKGQDIALFPAMYLDMKKEVLKLAQFCEQTKKLPFIKLCDITEEDGYKVLVGCHQNSHKLQAIKLLHDVGLLISYADADGESWICVNLNFCVDVVMLFTSAVEKLKSQLMFRNESVMSKDELYQHFQHFFENAATSVSWYSSVLFSGHVDSLFTFLIAQGLLLTVSARQFRPELIESKPSIQSELSISLVPDKDVFMLPMLTKARPSNWREVFYCLVDDRDLRFFFLWDNRKTVCPASWSMGKPCRIKGWRFTSSSAGFMITVTQFLALMLHRCRDSRFMWGFSFLYHTDDGTSVFVRLAENRRGVDIVTVGAATVLAASLISEIHQLVNELGLNDCPLAHLCPFCCINEDYVNVASAHAYSQPQLDRFKALALNASCHQLHQVEASLVQDGLFVQLPIALEPRQPFFPKTN